MTRRAVVMCVTLALLVTGLFFALYLLGSPISMLMGEQGGTQARADLIAARLGLDLPIWQQYLNYVAGFLQGDLGTSWRFGRPVTDMLLERLPATLTLGAIALTISLIISIPMGLFSAVRAGTWFDNLARVVAVGANSLPNFWFGIMLMIAFSVHLGVLPATGRGTWQHLVMPAIVLSTGALPMMTRVTRAAMLEVLNKDYIRTARSKGLPERMVLRRHALRNAMIPVSTVTAVRVGELVSGTVIIETVFAYPGVGRVIAEAMAFRDYPVVLGSITFVATAILLVTLITDIVYTFLDPRVRVS